MLDAPEIPMLNGTVADLLQVKGRATHVVAPDATVHEAVGKMDGLHVGALLVTENGALIGILSERDCTRRLILQSRDARETRVADVMSTGVITVDPTTRLDDCLRLVTHRRIRHLPVLEDGRLAGLVSIGDLVREVLTHQAETIQSLRSFIGGDYPK
jgi:CBS domain-containing protein